jgi:hypothetical protein
MAQLYGPSWTVKADTFRETPLYTPSILIQVESAGNDDTGAKYIGQRIEINGALAYVGVAPRSYRVSRLVWNNGWSFHSSNGYDVYGNSSGQAAALLAYIQTFNTSDILVLNTFDEPFKYKEAFDSELASSFKASMVYNIVHRSSYQLIASKGKGVIYEGFHAPASALSIMTTLYLG